MGVDRVFAVAKNTSPILQEIEHEWLGKIPKIFEVLSHSPVTLDAVWAQLRALSAGSLTARQREAIALRVAQLNRCEYCLAIHTYEAQRTGISYAATIDYRIGVSDDPFEQAILSLVTRLVIGHGRHAYDEVDEARRLSENGDLTTEIAANVSIHNLLNMFVAIYDLQPDYPESQPIPEEELTAQIL
jgi:AhpD family alkylhydroperoxidase